MNLKSNINSNINSNLTLKLAIFCAALVLCGAKAEAWEISGKVVDQSGNVISRASVTTNLPGLGTISEDSGYFKLVGAGEKPTRLTISHVGYKPELVSVTDIAESAPLVIKLNSAVIRGQGMTVYANRARAGETPVAFTDLTREEIERDYTVGDLPAVLETAPNVYVFSDAGSALGYNHISIRGFDEKRITTYINGVPLNDPEDHVTYFVDLPDFASNVRDVQIQRGIGSSLYADGAFGGSINVVSYALDQPRKFSFTTGIGGYNHLGDIVGETNRQKFEFSSGLIDGRYHILTRFSRQSSGGYMENSWSNGWGYFISASRLDPRSTTTFNTYGGPIRTHAAWDGIDLDTYRSNRRANFLTYINEGDNFNQPHYELHNTYKLSERSTLTSTLYYIRGKGYYEQFKTERDPVKFNVDTAFLADSLAGVDLVIQQWVKKNQIGLNSSVEIETEKGKRSFGVAGYYFQSEHYGQVMSSTNVVSGVVNGKRFVPGQRYYEYFGEKLNLSGFSNFSQRLTKSVRVQFSLQLRHLRYSFDQTPLGAYLANPYSFNLNWTFLSPRIGLNYSLSENHSLFGSFSVSSRTPRDQDVYDANDPEEAPDFTVKPERLYDYELGYQYRSQKFSASANLFYMWFNNEVIFYGVDDDGSRLTDNAESSYHSGVELSARIKPSAKFQLDMNLSSNYNRYDRYTVNTVVYDPPYGTVATNFSGNTIPGFPDVIGNFIADYKSNGYRFTYRFRGVGKQFVESSNSDSLSIAGFGISSFTGSASLAESSVFGKLSLSLTVNNIFDKLYIQSGYGGSYIGDSDFKTWGAYYPSAGRSFFALLNIDFE